MKLVIAEPETRALHESLVGHRLVSSGLVLTELPRAVTRVGVDHDDPTLRQALARVGLIALTRSRLRAAGRLEPTGLRTLDAIHLASALQVRHYIDHLVGYDSRLLNAASGHGLAISSPGATP